LEFGAIALLRFAMFISLHSSGSRCPSAPLQSDGATPAMDLPVKQPALSEAENGRAQLFIRQSRKVTLVFFLTCFKRLVIGLYLFTISINATPSFSACRHSVTTSIFCFIQVINLCSRLHVSFAFAPITRFLSFYRKINLFPPGICYCFVHQLCLYRIESRLNSGSAVLPFTVYLTFC